MTSYDTYIRHRRLLISLACTLLITYPNMMWIPWNLSAVGTDGELSFWVSMVFRCGFFFLLFTLQLGFNFRRQGGVSLLVRFGRNILFTLCGGIVFVSLSAFVPLLAIQSATVAKYLMFQFIVVSLICTFIGHIAAIDRDRRRREREIERLKIENLQSRCNALTNQINPHFFFNSLNGISALVRRGDDEATLGYVDRLSEIFRYILRSDREEQLVPLADEVRFVEAFAHLMEVRFGRRLSFDIKVDADCKGLLLPALSLLPLLENVTTHNRIDSTHPMTVTIRAQGNLLTVSNPVSPKISLAQTNGSGLDNLSRRFRLLKGEDIEVCRTDNLFTVKLPL